MSGSTAKTARRLEEALRQAYHLLDTGDAVGALATLKEAVETGRATAVSAESLHERFDLGFRDLSVDLEMRAMFVGLTPEMLDPRGNPQLVYGGDTDLCQFVIGAIQQTSVDGVEPPPEPEPPTSKLWTP